MSGSMDQAGSCISGIALSNWPGIVRIGVG
jgi:hypothetical protein